MKIITYDEWSERFEADADSEISDNPEDFAFYDNGAVKSLLTEDFVIKSDQVEKK